MRKTYKERGQALSKCRVPPLPPICIRAQFVANFQGDQICDNQQTAVIVSKIKIQQKSLTSFLVGSWLSGAKVLIAEYQPDHCFSH